MKRTTKSTELHSVAEITKVLDRECKNSLVNVLNGEDPKYECWRSNRGVLLSHEEFSSLNYYARVGIALVDTSLSPLGTITSLQGVMNFLDTLTEKVEQISKVPNHLSETVDD